MKTVAHILKAKPTQAIYTIAPTATVFEAISLMAEKVIGALIITEGDNIVGIITERDYARKIAIKERSSHDTQVQEVMTKDVLSVSSNQSTEHCMILMTEKHLRHLPVIDNGKLIGLISIGDIVKGVIEDQRMMIEELQRYIRGQ